MDKFKTTIIVVVIFFALLAFAYFYEKDKETKEDTELKKDEVTEAQVTDFDVLQVQKLSIILPESSFNFEKREDKWVLLQDEGFEVNSLKVETLLEGISKLKTQSKFDAESLSDYGLEEPVAAVEVALPDSSIALSFGESTPDQSKVYVNINDEKKVFTVPAAIQSSFEVTKESFDKNQAEETSALDEVELLKQAQGIN